jgi:hypothetical protein
MRFIISRQADLARSASLPLPLSMKLLCQCVSVSGGKEKIGRANFES